MFWFVLFGQVASQASSVVMQCILLLWVYKATGSVSELAIAGMLMLLPAAFLRPLVDMLVSGGGARRFLLASLLVTHLFVFLFLNDWLIAAYAGFCFAFLAFGLVQTFQNAAVMALSKPLLRPDLLFDVEMVGDFLEFFVFLLVVAVFLLFLPDIPIFLVLLVCLLCLLLAVSPVFYFSIFFDADTGRSARRTEWCKQALILSWKTIGGAQVFFLLAMFFFMSVIIWLIESLLLAKASMGWLVSHVQ